MKKIFSLILTALMAVPTFAGLNTINYQAVVKGGDFNQVQSNQNIGARFNIVSGDNVLFTEETTLKSNEEGVISYEIGSSNENGLQNIDWSLSGLMLEVSLDLKGGTDYTSTISSSISSVPTAMLAVKSLDNQKLQENVNDITNLAEENMMRTRALEDEVLSNKVMINEILVMTEKNMVQIDELQHRFDEAYTEVENFVMQQQEYITNIRVQIDQLVHDMMNQLQDLQNQIDNLQK